MCGRIVQKTTLGIVARNLGMEPEEGVYLPPRYNIPPGGPILACRSISGGRRELVSLRWGLIPSWAKDENVGFRMFNARAETIT